MPTAARRFPGPRSITRRIALGALPALCAAPGDAAPVAERAELELWRDEVHQHEIRFARTMAERDLAAFSALIAEDANFINGGEPLRGRAAIVEFWKRHFVSPAAPFSWAPELVEVLDTGQLAMSLGPVLSPQAQLIARFYSVWRRQRSGVWQVVFDNGYAVPACPPRP